jgi:hypothetical protein
MSTELKQNPVNPARSVPCYPQLSEQESLQNDGTAEDPPPPPPPATSGNRGHRPEPLAPATKRPQRS